MSLQAFIDDSYNPNGAFVLAGHIASDSAWAQFAKQWNALLPSAGTLASNGRYHFKMAEMAAYTHRLERVPAFYWIIEEHVLTSPPCKFDLIEFENAKKRVKSELLQFGFQVDFCRMESPYRVGIRTLLDMFHNYKSNFSDCIPLQETVDFVFDDQSEKKLILDSWNDYMKIRLPELIDLYGAKPRFENDQDFLPLQAADFWAWWVREWYEEDDIDLPEKMEKRGGPGCLNNFSASISGASAGVRLPSGAAAS
jgi:hypothetical protein